MKTINLLTNIASAVILASGAYYILNPEPPLINEYGETGGAIGTYYHLRAEYLVNKTEPLVFDLQVSCGRHTFDKGAPNERTVLGYLPALYAKKTQSGAAVMLAAPRICDAIRYAEDRKVYSGESEILQSWKQVAEGNLIPFTIWFDDADDLTLGYGYAIASSFDNPDSPLSLVDVTVEPSTAKKFETWFRSDADNILTERHLGPRFATSEEDKAYWANFDPEKQLLPLKCYGVAVVSHSERTAKYTAKYYPEDKPDYWFAPEALPADASDGADDKRKFVYGNGYYYSGSHEFPKYFNYLRRREPEGDRRPDSFWRMRLADYYPLTRNDGYPFAEKESLSSDRLVYKADLRREKKGLLSCFSLINPTGYGDENYRELYEYYFGSDYGPRLSTFGHVINLEITDDQQGVAFSSLKHPIVLPHFLIGDKAVAEFVTFEFFGGGHVR